ncbi:MAG: hypothetical protein IJ795_01770 [Bacteroidales bacterium]|nr:hypothetical protein [Bacteroidales bacterium]
MDRRFLAAAAVALLALSCATQRKAALLRDTKAVAQLSLTAENEIPLLNVGQARRDTLTVTGADGREMLIMRAVKDEDGEMVATDVIDAAVVTARFRNVAERGGKVDLSFDVTVPKEMQDSRWQLRFNPLMFIMEDTLALERIVITGNDYRKAQLRGYQQYQRFLDSIITDTTRFVNTWQLEVFLRRNLPQIYKFRSETSFVSDEEFASAYGVTEREAVDHYTWWYMVRRNRWKIENKDKMFRKYVKVPLVSEGLRLDTVITNADNDIVYRYVQTVATRPRLKKVDICLSGEIYEQDKRIYRIPDSDPLSFYISSLSSLADDREKYLTKVLERKVEANTACYIDFGQGSDVVDERLGENREEIARIKDNLASLMENKKFDLDSIVVIASCSPEGSWKYNDRLSLRRSSSVSEYFSRFMEHWRDSLRQERGMVLDLAGVGQEENRQLPFISRSDAENWSMLSSIVASDNELTAVQKQDFARIMEIEDPDRREEALSRESSYRYLREKLYPRLRTVRFNFHLHRKGMVKDTIHTTVIDSTYMAGIQALKDRDYKQAVTLLRPYGDYNAAVAYCAMDYNASAMAILETLEPDYRVEYLKAILYSRAGDDRNAVQSYLNSCTQNRAMVNRGNLDPEISVLISRYGLNKETD